MRPCVVLWVGLEVLGDTVTAGRLTLAGHTRGAAAADGGAVIAY